MSTSEQRVRALRGATTVARNTEAAITDATMELLAALLSSNEVAAPDIVSIVFTTTEDLDAGFPASAAHRLGLDEVPLLCTKEIDVPGSLPRCVRVLMHLYTTRDPTSLQHVYLRDAVTLRVGRRP